MKKITNAKKEISDTHGKNSLPKKSGTNSCDTARIPKAIAEHINITNEIDFSTTFLYSIIFFSEINDTIRGNDTVPNPVIIPNGILTILSALE